MARVPQRQDSIRAPFMDRAGGSNSSNGTTRSFQSTNAFSPTSSYAESPVSEDGPTFPQTSPGFRRNSLWSPSSPASPTWVTDAPAAATTPIQEWERSSVQNSMPLLDIEKDGDPRIRPETYYDFKVDKKEAYFELKPGHLVTPKFPRRKEVSPNRRSGKREHKCRNPFCEAKPFTRHYDLERHFSSMHKKGNVYCDYKKCPHEEPFRKDHAREHYREYHMEDLVKRNDPRVQEFLSNRAQRVNLTWWRCSRCLSRVYEGVHGYNCNECKLSCEPERVQMRENLVRERKYSQDENQFVHFSCGACQNMWIPHKKNPDRWDPCPTCQPGVTMAVAG